MKSFWSCDIPVMSVIFFSTPHSLCLWVVWEPSWHLLLTDTEGRRTHQYDWPRSVGCPHSGHGTSSGNGHSRCKTCGWQKHICSVVRRNQNIYLNNSQDIMFKIYYYLLKIKSIHTNCTCGKVLSIGIKLNFWYKMDKCQKYKYR